MLVYPQNLMQPAPGDGSEHMFEGWNNDWGSAALNGGYSSVCPRSTLHLLPASLFRRLTHTRHINGVLHLMLSRGGQPMRSPRRSLQGWSRVRLGYLFPRLPPGKMPTAGCFPEVIAPVGWPSLPHPLFPGSTGAGTSSPQPRSSVLSLWSLPYTLPTH